MSKKSTIPGQNVKVGSSDLLAVFEILKLKSKPDKKKEDSEYGKLEKSAGQQKPDFPKGPPSGSTWDFSMVPKDSSVRHYGG